jgi:hypothetical protein
LLVFSVIFSIALPLVAAVDSLNQFRQQRIDRRVEGRLLCGSHPITRDDPYMAIPKAALGVLHFFSGGVGLGFLLVLNEDAVEPADGTRDADIDMEAGAGALHAL